MLVTTDMASAPNRAIVRRSACMPAPPVLSEPVMVSMGAAVCMSVCRSVNDNRLIVGGVATMAAAKFLLQNNAFFAI